MTNDQFDKTTQFMASTAFWWVAYTVYGIFMTESVCFFSNER